MKKILYAFMAIAMLAAQACDGDATTKDENAADNNTENKEEIPAVSLSFSEESIEMTTGEAIQMELSIEPEYLRDSVAWNSNDPEVAKVEKGLVTALSEGTAIITASLGRMEAKCEVKVSKASPIKAIDLGLSVKWGSCNLGAEKPEDCGDYYAWGETEPKNNYIWATYKWRITNSSNDGVSKYCDTKGKGVVDDLDVLLPEDDAAHVNLGGKWRIPSQEDMIELTIDCTWKWTFKDKIWGYIVTGPNGNSIFLPAAGERVDTLTLWVGTADKEEDCYGWYWYSKVYSPGNQNGRHLNICYDWYSLRDDPRCNGYSIRPVSD